MPIKYIPYMPTTIEGQAVLDNIVRSQRILRYRDNDKVYNRLERGMPYYELDKLETVGTADSGNLLIHGECLSACAYLKAQGITVDLVYIDPPFASGADYAKKIYLRRNPKLAEQLASAEQELDNDALRSFEETMYGDIWQKEDYLNWMYENLLAIKSVMSDAASIYVHLDWHIGHYVKILLDEVFGEGNFLNEIIWVYKERESSKKFYNRKHDTIYFYVLDSDAAYPFNFDDIRDEYSETTIQKFKYTDEDGRKYRLRYKDGRNDPNEETEDTYRQYLDEADGTLPRDWFTMPIVNQAANERADYATQKPEALLERIIKASSNEGMVVADFFGGSGVTAKVAHDLGRQFIHCDVGVNSIQTARDRLIKAGASCDILEIQDGVKLFRNPQQTMDKLASLIPNLQQGVAELDNFWFGAVQDSKLGTVPVYVPNLLNSHEKVLDIPLANTIINQALPDLDDTIKKVLVYYIDIAEPKQLAKFIKDNNPTLIKVELQDLKQILHHVVLEDEVSWRLETTDTGYVLHIDSFVSDRLNQKIATFNEKGQLQALKKSKAFHPISISDSGLELIEMIALDCNQSEGVWQSSHEIYIDKKGYITRDRKMSKEFWDSTIQASEQPLRLKIRNISGDETIWKLP